MICPLLPIKPSVRAGREVERWWSFSIASHGRISKQVWIYNWIWTLSRNRFKVTTPTNNHAHPLVIGFMPRSFSEGDISLLSPCDCIHVSQYSKDVVQVRRTCGTTSLKPERPCGLLGFEDIMAPFPMPSKTAKISLQTINYSPWGSKNRISSKNSCK